MMKWIRGILVFDRDSIFDLIGEFVAQGKLSMVIMVSFVIAAILLVLALAYRRMLHRENP